MSYFRKTRENDMENGDDSRDSSSNGATGDNQENKPYKRDNSDYDDSQNRDLSEGRASFNRERTPSRPSRGDRYARPSSSGGANSFSNRNSSSEFRGGERNDSDNREYRPSYNREGSRDGQRRDFNPRGDRDNRSNRSERDNRNFRDNREDRSENRERRDFGDKREGSNNYRKNADGSDKFFGKVEENAIFGIHAVMEALKSEKSVEKVLVKQGVADRLFAELNTLCAERNISIHLVPPDKFMKYQHKNHQGVIAFMGYVEYLDLFEVLDKSMSRGEVPLVLMLDGVTDVRNLGAIARSAYCSGVTAIVIATKGAGSINGDAVKTSAGALLKIPICRVGSLRTTIHTLKQLEINVVCTSQKASKTIYESDLKVATLIIMGSEGEGVAPDLIKLCDESLAIPMVGDLDSLNVSVATSLITFEALRQRKEF